MSRPFHTAAQRLMERGDHKRLHRLCGVMQQRSLPIPVDVLAALEAAGFILDEPLTGE